MITKEAIRAIRSELEDSLEEYLDEEEQRIDARVRFLAEVAISEVRDSSRAEIRRLEAIQRGHS